ncbi:MAG TPA: large conductance mechanosensitive channel protein MscL [Candidatus Avamphibacillus intestinigallinarum]|nr:large conductance mechanosensitive channel protein MscL [Candidatus Avamphibacillus intestinigallinarum]
MWKDFKEFAMEGNVLDLAVGVIIGAAFGKIVSSLVDSIIMPLLSIFTSENNVSNWSYTIGGAEIMYGDFLQSIIDFFIIAFSIFIFIRLLMKFKRHKDEEVEEVTAEEALLTEIRDLLRQQNQS